MKSTYHFFTIYIQELYIYYYFLYITAIRFEFLISCILSKSLIITLLLVACIFIIQNYMTQFNPKKKEELHDTTNLGMLSTYHSVLLSASTSMLLQWRAAINISILFLRLHSCSTTISHPGCRFCTNFSATDMENQCLRNLQTPNPLRHSCALFLKVTRIGTSNGGVMLIDGTSIIHGAYYKLLVMPHSYSIVCIDVFFFFFFFSFWSRES